MTDGCEVSHSRVKDLLLSSLYVFSNSLTRFVDLFGGFPLQRLMRAHLIVVEQILLQFVPELRQGGERGAVDQVVVQGPPEPFHLPIGLRPIGPGIPMFDPQLQQHPFKRVRVFGARGREFGSIVR